MTPVGFCRVQALTNRGDSRFQNLRGVFLFKFKLKYDSVEEKFFLLRRAYYADGFYLIDINAFCGKAHFVLFIRTFFKKMNARSVDSVCVSVLVVLLVALS